VPSTLEALGVFLLAVLPGALFIWAVERDVGRWGVRLSDRILRFIAASAIFQVLFLGPLYLLRSEYWHHEITAPGGEMRFENRIADGDALPWWLFLTPIVYLGLPIAAGTLAARAARSSSRAAEVATWVAMGADPEPRAWDYLFWKGPSGFVRLRLKGEPPHTWVGGLFGANSYAAGYPETPQDLWLEKTYVVQEDGEFATENGNFVETVGGLLVRWDDVDLLEFFQVEGATGEDGDA
jgi:hypothetical protein